MPVDVEEVFEAVQVPLFPASRGDLVTDCSCPDWANPCKHIAAVYYLLGERFDEEPFLLFELRGRNQEEISLALRERRAVELKTDQAAPYAPTLLEAIDVPALGDSVDRYWTLGQEAADLSFSIAPPQVPAALLKRVGIPNFDGVNPRNFQRQMERVYDGVTVATIRLAFTDSWE
jgi:uncharacterized Zn finger protein